MTDTTDPLGTTDTETLRSRWQLLALRGKHPLLSEVTALLRGELLPGVQARHLCGQWPFDLATLLAPRDPENWGRLLSDFAAAAALDDDLFDRLDGEGPDIWMALAGSWTAELAWNDAVSRLQDNPHDLLDRHPLMTLAALGGGDPLTNALEGSLALLQLKEDTDFNFNTNLLLSLSYLPTYLARETMSSVTRQLMRRRLWQQGLHAVPALCGDLPVSHLRTEILALGGEEAWDQLLEWDQVALDIGPGAPDLEARRDLLLMALQAMHSAQPTTRRNAAPLLTPHGQPHPDALLDTRLPRSFGARNLRHLTRLFAALRHADWTVREARLGIGGGMNREEYQALTGLSRLLSQPGIAWAPTEETGMNLLALEQALKSPHRATDAALTPQRAPVATRQA